MSNFNKNMNLKDFAIAVAKGLSKHDIDVVLTGGAVVSIYSEGKYVSKDADFLSETDNQNIESAMLEIGFKRKGKDFTHPDTEFSAEFPGRLLVIGDEPLKRAGLYATSSDKYSRALSKDCL